MPNYSCSIWKLSKRPKPKSLYWKNLLYETLEKNKPGSGGRSITYKWPIEHDDYDDVALYDIEKRAKLNDWVIVDETDSNKPKAHFISSTQMGDTGTLYYYDGNKWNQVMSRAGMVYDKDVNSRQPAHLQWIEGEKGDLLVASYSPTTKKQAEALLNEQHPFLYKYIRGTEVLESTQLYDTWKVKYGGSITERDGSDAAVMIEKQNKRQEREDAIEQVYQTIKDDPNWPEDKDTKDVVKKYLILFFENTESSATVGTTAPVAIPGVFSEFAKNLKAFKDAQTGIEGLASTYLTLYQAYDLYRCLTQERPNSGEIKEKSTALVESFSKAGVSFVSFYHACVKAAGAVPSNLTVTANVASFAGAAISLFESGRNFRKFHRANKRGVGLTRILRQIEIDDSDDDENPNGFELTRMIEFAREKIERKKRRLGGTVLAGTYGGVGGILVGAAAVGAANFWNPVGWGVGFAGLAVGGAITTYVIIRKVTKKSRHKKRLEKGKPKNAEDFAEKLIALYRTKKDGKNYMEAEHVLHLFGVKAANGKIGDDPDQVAAAGKAIKRIVRHFS